MSRVLDQIGDDAEKIRPLYITVDPERDTPEVMRSYLETDYPRFTGLTGAREQIDAAKKSFRVFAEAKPDPEDPKGYIVPHTAISYLMGPDGGYRDHFTDAADEEKILKRIATAVQRGVNG